MKKLLFGFLILQTVSAFATPAGDLGLNAHSLKLKIYKMAVSTAADCSSPVTVIDNGLFPIETDVKGENPVFGSGTIANGTYPCVMLEVSDTIKYSGQMSTSGNCSPASETARDLCRLDNAGTTQLLDGSTFSCTDAEDHVVIYLSTDTAVSPSGNGFVPPGAPGSQDGAHLGSPLIVSGSSVGRLNVSTNGYLCDNANDTASHCDGPGDEANSSAACRLEGADFSFSN